MKIPVLGMDPSMSNWGLAAAELDLTTGVLETPALKLISPKPVSGKQVRQNSKDLQRSEDLAKPVWEQCRQAKAIFVEVPVGSQSARAMASYGMCVGILGALRAEGIQLIEVTPSEVKVALSGDAHATKRRMIDAASELYPDANWPPLFKGRLPDKSEHLADAIGAIHAGVRTPLFQNLMRLLEGQ